ncbi:MAG: multidrug efflux pump subunit AcrB, partial [Nonlabens sp.]|uniref:efflux RND transporter permease subunit n=1 Tax=Nonlabens sp. TaxID=1888209 RepID=UPI0039E62579
MRKIIAYFINHHVAVNVVIAAFVIFGVLGAISLKSSYFPLVDSKTITINVIYQGAAPQEIEEGVVLKIEDNLKGIEGIDRVTSVSRENSGTITIEITKGYNIDFMLLEVKNAVDRVSSFPIGMEPLVVAKREESRPTISFALSGKNVPLKTLKQLARDVENDLRAIEGISQISITGYPAEEIEIAINENTLLGYNMSFQEVADAVAASNILTTGGKIKTDTEEYLIRADNRSYYGDELNHIPVRTQTDGTIIYLKDVAEVKDRFSETPNASYFNEERAVNITVTSTNAEDL